MMTPKRYHPALVGLHWLIATLIFVMLLMGYTRLGGTPNDEAKIQTLSLHMPIGITIVALTLIRFGVRLATKKPAPATAGHPLLDKIGVATHYLLYLAALGMGLSGMGIAALAGLLPIVFERSGSLPPDFAAFSPAIGHAFLSFVLSGLVLLHIGAALYHQFIRKDNLLARMWFGKGQ
ncbi:MAG: cytochrome b/b6 domain-containing protein [Anaerolineales bacterium]|jgi:cytochrome b561|nr:cytochrome b/b6 domain-containing protein [Anaerolineales bacterium]